MNRWRFIEFRIAFDDILFAGRHILRAFLEERVIAHQIVFGNFAHRDVFGFVADAVTIELLFVNVNAG